MSRKRHWVGLGILLALMVGAARAEDFPEAEVVGLGPGVVRFKFKGKEVVKRPAPVVVGADSSGHTYKGIESAKLLAPGNIVNITTGNYLGREMILKITLVRGTVLKSLETRAETETGGAVSVEGSGTPKSILTHKISPEKWNAQFKNVKAGDFIVYTMGRYVGPTRVEAVEVGDGYVVDKVTSQSTGKPSVVYRKWVPAEPTGGKMTTADARKTPAREPKSRAKTKPQSRSKTKGRSAGARGTARNQETIVVNGHSLDCTISVEGPAGGPSSRVWTSPEVPFDGKVRSEVDRQIVYQLLDFGHVETSADANKAESEK